MTTYMARSELKELCGLQGLPVSGNKTQLRARLVSFGIDDDSATDRKVDAEQTDDITNPNKLHKEELKTYIPTIAQKLLVKLVNELAIEVWHEACVKRVYSRGFLIETNN